MKERPILFSGAMVRAILSGRKTQTRRVCKSLIWTDVEDMPPNCTRYGNVAVVQKCPYGESGDRLWVKETFSTDAVCMYPCPQAWYRATDFNDRSDLKGWHVCPKHARGRWADCLACWEEREGRKFRWKPSIFMPRLLSRITLEIVSVRVERLEDISEADALAEGIERDAAEFKNYNVKDKAFPWVGGSGAAVFSYRTLWESINGAGSWEANPWVWVVEFKKL